MHMNIYELNALYYCDTNKPQSLKDCLTHVVNIPDDAEITISRGKPVIVLPPTSPHSPRITLTLEIAMFAAAKKTIRDLYHVHTIDGAPSK